MIDVYSWGTGTGTGTATTPVARFLWWVFPQVALMACFGGVRWGYLPISACWSRTGDKPPPPPVVSVNQNTSMAAKGRSFLSGSLASHVSVLLALLCFPFFCAFKHQFACMYVLSCKWRFCVCAYVAMWTSCLPLTRPAANVPSTDPQPFLSLSSDRFRALDFLAHFFAVKMHLMARSLYSFFFCEVFNGRLY